MSFTVPFGWDQDSDNLYVHASSVRIQRMTYRSQEGWVLIPRGKEDPVLQFPPTQEGRDMAFAAFATGAFALKSKGGPAIDLASEPAVARKLGDG
jgi:hypothetical protein